MGKWRIPGLGQGKYRKSLEYSVVPGIKELLKHDGCMLKSYRSQSERTPRVKERRFKQKAGRKRRGGSRRTEGERGREERKRRREGGRESRRKKEGKRKQGSRVQKPPFVKLYSNNCCRQK